MCFLALGLMVEAELDLALLPGSDTGGAEQDRHRVAAGDRLLNLRLPGLALGERVASRKVEMPTVVKCARNASAAEVSDRL